MIDHTVPVPEPKPAKKRRSEADLKDFLRQRIKALEARGDIKIKKALERLSKEVQEIALKRPTEPKLGQAASLLMSAASAIQVPQ